MRPKMIRGLPGVLLVLVGFSSACSHREHDESETLFRTEVVPMFEQRCAGLSCHGARTDTSNVGELPEGSFTLDVDSKGRIVDWREARTHALAKIDVYEAAAFSTLIRKPLPMTWGGLAHAGGDNLTSMEDPATQTLVRWIDSETVGGEDPSTDLDELESLFAREVQPKLFVRGCALTNCHGPTSFVPFRLDPGLPLPDGTTALSIEMTRRNYREARKFLTLGGQPDQSRLLRKSLPLDRGGILHRGGNRSFASGPEDSLYRSIVDWCEAEQAALYSPDKVEGLPIVYVSGPVRPGSVFDITTFVPGTDLYYYDPSSSAPPVNLTSELHALPADIRDPTVAADGKRVAFSIRRSENEPALLYEIDLDTGEGHALTTGPATLPSGAPAVAVTPVYGHDDWVYFAANYHDVLAERGDTTDIDIYRVPESGGSAERVTFTPAPELEPSLFSVGALSGYLVFGYRRAVDDRDKTVGFSFPFDRHVDYHIFFGITAEATVFHRFRELPDGRALTTAADVSNVWEGGQLAIIDRNLGPDLVSGTTVSLPGYTSTLRVLDPAVRASGISPGGVYRDPSPLPDGRVLVSFAEGPIDLSEPSVVPDFRIVMLTLSEAPEACVTLECLPGISEMTTVIDVPGSSEVDVVAVWRRPESPPRPSVLDPDAPTLFSMMDVAVNDGIMLNLEPADSKHFRRDVRYVRFVEAVAERPSAWPPSQDARPSAHAPARILGEVELQDDLSLHVELPPQLSFRTQLLDERRMVVGHQHNRWIFLWPGQHFSQSTTRGSYDERCGGCHGSESGDPADVLRPPDTTTQASVTLARYEDQNPRRPRDATTLDERTRITTEFADVNEILQDRCGGAACHPASPGLPMSTGSDGYRTLLARETGLIDRGGRARASHLIELALNEELDAARSVASHPSVEMSAAQLLTLVRWIEVGAPFRVPGGEP